PHFSSEGRTTRGRGTSPAGPPDGRASRVRPGVAALLDAANAAPHDRMPGMTGAPAPCPGCGLAAGRAACQDTFNDVALRVRALAWTDSLKTWRLMHDVYNIQHPDEHCRS